MQLTGVVRPHPDGSRMALNMSSDVARTRSVPAVDAHDIRAAALNGNNTPCTNRHTEVTQLGHRLSLGI